MEIKFQELIRWLLFGKLDFDYIAESVTARSIYGNGKQILCRRYAV